MAFVSFAQNAEDVLLFRAFRHLEQGYYIDIGANHPVEDSVTKAFYDRGWRGVNVEPVAFWFNQLEEARAKDLNFQIAISDRDEFLEFFEVEETGLSTLDPDRAAECIEQGYSVMPKKVACWTLAHLFERIGSSDVHFLKIDVEGAEAQVIRSGDWNKHRPWIVLVESTRPNTNCSEHESWEPVLIGADYQFIWFDGVNRYYLAQEHSGLAEAFRIPVNVLDDYITYREVALTESRCQLILDMEWKQSDFQTELLSAKYAINSAKEAHNNAINALSDLEFESRSAKAELANVKTAFETANEAHANAINALESAQEAHSNATRLLDWYHQDFLIGSAIRVRKLPGFIKRRLGALARVSLNATDRYLERFPGLKVSLVNQLSAYPGLIGLLQRLSGRDLTSLSDVNMGTAEDPKRQSPAVKKLLDKMNQEKP